jgi:hypothetical protein
MYLIKTMKLTRAEVKSIVLWGWGGLISGILYEFVHVIALKYTSSGVLEPKTTHICDDDELFTLMYQMQEYAYINKPLFSKFVLSVDKLLGYRKQIEIAEEIVVEDRPYGFLLYSSVKKKIEKFVILSKKTSDSQIQVEIYRIYEKIMNVISDHWNIILAKTKEV